MTPLVPLRIPLRTGTSARSSTPQSSSATTDRGGVIELGLVLTHACNLACVYCYTGEKKRVRMSDEVARAGVQMGFDLATRHDAALQLGFFGGEPLLERALLLSIATSAREHAAATRRALRLQVTTNGTLLTDELVDALAELRVQVALSLDGTQARHDAGRPLAGGGSSWASTHAGLRRLVAARDRAPFDVIAVVDPCNVAGLSDDVASMIDDGVEALSLNVNWGATWDEAALAVLESQLERIAAILLAWVRRGRWIRIQPLESALRSLLDLGRVVVASCASGSRRLAVAPSGRLYGCARAVGEDDGRAAIGDVYRGVLGPEVDARDGTSLGCSCANAEETGDRLVAGRIRIRHDRHVEQLAIRLGAALGESFERIVVTEQGFGP